MSSSSSYVTLFCLLPFIFSHRTRLSFFFPLLTQFQALSTPLLTPLEVIATRLSLQRTHAPTYSPSQPQEDLQTTAAEESVAFFAEGGENVVGFVSEDEPYRGLMDCVTRIAGEEGWQVLARGWWITLGGNLLRGFP